MPLDIELVQRIEYLVDRYHEFESLRMKQEGLRESLEFAREEIERRCADKNYAPQPYVEMYFNMVTRNLEKKCIRRAFPNALPDKCDKPCRGYDKFCADYTPTERFDFSEIADMMDYRENMQKYQPPQNP